MRISVCLLLVLIAVPAYGKHLHKEAWYQARWCEAANGESEVVMPDRTRCDCVTATHAVEFDFANKWAESIGQALLYGAHTGKRPGIVLIIEKDKDMRYVRRVHRVIQEYGLPVDVWVTRP